MNPQIKENNEVSIEEEDFKQTVPQLPKVDNSYVTGSINVNDEENSVKNDPPHFEGGN